MNTLKNIPIESSKTAKIGHIILNILNKETLDKAKEEMGSRNDDFELQTSKKRKLQPKIMICNVSNEEQVDKITDYIWHKNHWLK